MSGKLWKVVASAVLSIGTLVGVTVATAAPAQASTTYRYAVNHKEVCNRQGHFGASYWNGFDAFSWYCYDFSIPAGVTFTGGLDIDGWCQSKYGARAELANRYAWGWECVRREG